MQNLFYIIYETTALQQKQYQPVLMPCFFRSKALSQLRLSSPFNRRCTTISQLGLCMSTLKVMHTCAGTWLERSICWNPTQHLCSLRWHYVASLDTHPCHKDSWLPTAFHQSHKGTNHTSSEHSKPSSLEQVLRHHHPCQAGSQITWVTVPVWFTNQYSYDLLSNSCAAPTPFTPLTTNSSLSSATALRIALNSAFTEACCASTSWACITTTPALHTSLCTPRHHSNHTTTKTILQPFFQDHPGEPVAEKNFWTLWCKGK